MIKSIPVTQSFKNDDDLQKSDSNTCREVMVTSCIGVMTAKKLQTALLVILCRIVNNIYIRMRKLSEIFLN